MITALAMIAALTFSAAFNVNAVEARVIESVAAYVDDNVITTGELEDQYQATLSMNAEATREAVLDTMINRVLLLREAHNLRIGGENEDEVLKEYIALKVRAFIKISEEEIRRFYDENIEEMGSLPFEKQKEHIETLLQEREVNRRLKRHIEELRSHAHIVTFIDGEGR